ncbi:MAG TPA: hypothetical protein VFD03_11955 [Clostridia bacterium]|nr:hypothetical protein [Clostridia bacterium]
MNKKQTGYLYYAIAVMWMFSAIINSVVSVNYFSLNMKMAVIYGILVLMSIGLAIAYVLMGNKKRK